MSNLAEQLSDYGTSLKYADLPSDVVHLAKRFIIDTIGCALGGYDSEPYGVIRYHKYISLVSNQADWLPNLIR